MMDNLPLTDMDSAPLTFENAEWEDWLRWDPATEPMSADTSSKSSNASPLASVGQPGELVPWLGGEETLSIQPEYVQDMSGFADTFICKDQPLFDFTTGATTEPFIFGEDTINTPITSQYHAIPPFMHGLQLPKDTGTVVSQPAVPQPPPSTDRISQISPSWEKIDAVDSQQPSPTSASAGSSTMPSMSPTTSASNFPARKKPGRKRKSEVNDGAEADTATEPPPTKKTSHNVIEKRYRNNLNDKIQELRDAVPSLRATSRGSGSDCSEDLEGLTPAHKLNKTTVMAKATEYIRHLEKRNKTMTEEMAELRSRISSLENSVATSTALQQFNPGLGALSRRQPLSSIAEDQQTGTMTPDTTDVKVPRKANGRRANTLGKLMVGAMAGMMAVEGLHEQDVLVDTSSGTGSVPLNLFKRSLEPHTLSEVSRTKLAFAFLKLTFVLGALVYLILPLFSRKPRRKMVRSVAPKPAVSGKTSLASPVEMRRKAWLTAIQNVWSPRPFLVEVVFVTVRMAELSVRRIVGFNRYAKLLGMTKEQEAARIKTWDIAIDAQLAGGDAQVNYYRLLLTIMASGTLPDSPIRLMQKAVHFDIFFWELANAGYGNFFGCKAFTAYVAKLYWKRARVQHRALVSDHASRQDELNDSIDILPDHLAALIELDCDDVLNDNIIQRAYNLAWNKATSEDTQASPTLDSVVEDHAVRSPLDAIAAWFTHAILDEALSILVTDNGDVSEAETLIHLAVTTAPPASASLTRALVARAALIEEGREANIKAAMAAIPTKAIVTPTSDKATTAVMPMNVVDHIPLTPDIRTVLTFAKLLSIASAVNPQSSQVCAASSLVSVSLTQKDMTMLTVVTAIKVMDTFANNAVLFSYGRSGLDNLATSLRLWTQSSASRKHGLGKDQREQIADTCLLITEKIKGGQDEEEQDSAYASVGRSRRLSGDC